MLRKSTQKVGKKMIILSFCMCLQLCLIQIIEDHVKISTAFFFIYKRDELIQSLKNV